MSSDAPAVPDSSVPSVPAVPSLDPSNLVDQTKTQISNLLGHSIKFGMGDMLGVICLLLLVAIFYNEMATQSILKSIPVCNASVNSGIVFQNIILISVFLCLIKILLYHILHSPVLDLVMNSILLIIFIISLATANETKKKINACTAAAECTTQPCNTNAAIDLKEAVKCTNSELTWSALGFVLALVLVIYSVYECFSKSKSFETGLVLTS